MHDTRICLSRPSPHLIIAVEDFLVGTPFRHADSVRLPHHRCEVGDDYQVILWGFAPSEEGQDALLAVLGIDPAEAFLGVIQLPEAGAFSVEPVQCPAVVPKLFVQGVIQEVPVQTLLAVPFNELPELVAHEEQLFAWVGDHVGQEQPEARKLLPVIPGHLVQEGLFAVHHLIVGQG